jgi:NitT/TauT family transport system substrate-binding protein
MLRSAARYLSLFASAALLVGSQLLPARAEDNVSLRVDWTTLGYHAPFYYGVAKGFYKEAGLNLRIEEGKGSGTAIALAGTNADDFAFADATTAAKLIGDGVPVKVVMGIFQRSGLSIFFRKDAMRTPKDLAGKRISMCAGDNMSVYLPAYIKNVGLSASDVQFITVDCSAKFTVVARGQADAVATYGMAGEPNMEAVGIARSARFDFADAGIVLPSHGIIVSESKLKANPDMVRRFLAATARSWEEARKDPDGAVKAVLDARPLLQGKEATLKSTLMESFNYLGGTAGKPFGWQSPADWQKTVAILAEFAGLKKTSPEAFYTNDFGQ